MEKLFIEILNVSYTSLFIILAVILLRLIFRKAPKRLNLCYWVLVFIKLLIPIKIESSLSLVPVSNVIPQNIVYAKNPSITSEIAVIDNTVNPVLQSSMSPTLGNSVNPMQIVMYIVSNIWVLGVAAMLIYALTSYVILKRKVRVSIKAYDNVYYCDYIESPFVLGVIKPKIYLPSGISEKEAELVILHEKAHIKRLDHISKFIGFIPLAVHWFNPLVWLSYHLFSKDIESAADESVIGNKEISFKKEYSETLLTLSNKRKVLVCPLAFGEIGVKQRVKNILSFKKPTVWVVILSAVICIVLAVCFLTSPSTKSEIYTGDEIDGPTSYYFSEDVSLEEIYPQYFDLDKTNGLKVYVWQTSTNSYYCGLLSGKDTTHTDEEIWNLKGCGISAMRVILKSYEIDKNDIAIEAITMPHSSYKYNIDKVYIEYIYELFGLSDSEYLREKLKSFNNENPDIIDFEYFSNYITPDLKFKEDLKAEFIFEVGYVTNDFTGTLYTDGNVKLEIYYDGKWYEYAYFMSNVMDYDYALPEYQGEGNYYSLSFSEISLVPKQFRIAVPIDFNAMYGDLKNGKYRVTKTLYYESDDGELQSKDYVAEFESAYARNNRKTSHKYDLIFTGDLKCEVVYRIESNSIPLDSIYINNGEFGVYKNDGNNWVEYETYMRRRGYDYAKNELENPTSYEYVLEDCALEPGVYEIKFPFDIEAVYGNLTSGTYQLRTEMDFTDVNGVWRTQYINEEFAIIE